MPHNFAVEYQPGDRSLTLPQVRKLVASLPAERAAVVAYIVATAADWRSVHRAELADYDRKRGQVLVRGSKNRHRWRVVPVLPQFAALFRQAWRSLPFQPWPNVRRDLEVACRHAGLPYVSPRDLRRSTGKILRSGGAAPHLIAGMLGHADSRMVERVYGRITPEDLGAQITNSTQRARRSGHKRRRKAKD